MLAVAAAAIGNSRAVRLYDDLLVRPVIWSALLCPAEERISYLLYLIIHPLILHQSHFAEGFDHALGDHLDAIEDWKKLPLKSRGPMPRLAHPKFPMFYLSSHHPRIIAQNLHQNPRGLLLCLQNLHPALASLNSAHFNVSPMSIDLHKNYPPTIFLPRPFLAVTGLFPPRTPNLFLDLFLESPDPLANFLLAQPAPPGSPIAAGFFPTKLRQAWHETIVNVRAIPEHIHRRGPDETPLAFDSVAHKIFVAAHDRLHANAQSQSDPLLAAHLHNLVTYIPRLALIFHLIASGDSAADETTIGQSPTEDALALVEFFTSEAERLRCRFPDPTDDDQRDFDRLMNLIRSLGGRVTPRQLMHCSRRFRASVNIAISFLQSLVDAGLGQITWPRKNGRPSMLFQLTASGNGNETPRHTLKNEGFVDTPSDQKLPP
ncbi:MAG: DUF3987 domain-containing protein [Tepidisphaeraceae bacterium]